MPKGAFMDKFEFSDEDKTEMDAQFSIWASFLNTAVGLLSFTLGIACLGTNSPSINAWLCLFVVILIRIDGARFIPSNIKVLRERAKTDPKTKIFVTGLEQHYLGWNAMFTKFSLFIFGFLFLMLIALSFPITMVFPLWAEYVGT
jgi:hypothetical protein